MIWMRSADGFRVDNLIDIVRGHRCFAPLLRFAIAYPTLVAWIVLSTGVILLLSLAGRRASLPFGSWLVLYAAAMLVSALCVFIVGGGDDQLLKRLARVATSTSDRTRVLSCSRRCFKSGPAGIC